MVIIIIEIPVRKPERTTVYVSVIAKVRTCLENTNEKTKLDITIIDDG